MRVAVTYDGAAPLGAPDIAGVMDAVAAVVDALGRQGHAAFPVALDPPLGWILRRLETVDAVFNLAEGLGGRSGEEPRAAALQELSGRPVTGAPSETLALCRDKHRVNAILAAEGLPVPAWTRLRPGEEVEWDRFPAIVKPASEDGSVGIHEHSVVDHAWELPAALVRAPRASLLQAFVAGRELNVGLVGDMVLPVSEISFAGRQRVLSWAAKWQPGSEADRDTRPVCPARLGADLHDRVVALARAAWRAVGGRGYGRVDLRTDASGEPFILEVNPNPDLAPGAGLARMAGAAGWGYDGLVARVLEAAR